MHQNTQMRAAFILFSIVLLLSGSAVAQPPTKGSLPVGGSPVGVKRKEGVSTDGRGTNEEEQQERLKGFVAEATTSNLSDEELREAWNKILDDEFGSSWWSLLPDSVLARLGIGRDSGCWT